MRVGSGPGGAPEGTFGSLDSFGARRELVVGTERFTFCALDAVPGAERLPVSLKIVLENLLRHENGVDVTAEHIRAVADWPAGGGRAIQFSPSRVFLHDTNGVPVLADLAALRAALAEAGAPPTLASPVVAAELTVDHSVSTDVSGRRDAPGRNAEREYRRNAERYRFLRWGGTLDGLRVVPPGSGIMHQINLEYLARVVDRRASGDGAATWVFPDTCAGTDSHTTMVNGLGVLGWGIGGIEAEAALLGLPVTMVLPPVVGVELTGALRAGVTATDLVLHMVEMLRGHGVVGCFVEFFGESVARLPVADRATVANMCPEFGATAAMFPIDAATLDYLRLTGRPPGQVALVETYAQRQGLWPDRTAPVHYNSQLRLALDSVEPSLAGPRRPQDRVPLARSKAMFRVALERTGPGAASASRATPPAAPDSWTLGHGSVVIAAITSCTNTSNPSVMVGAGLLARNARRRGLRSKPWVKTSLAPGSKVVTEYLARSGLSRYLDELGFHLVGYGCMTCIGNSGPLLAPVAEQLDRDRPTVVSVLSGNRNFDGRIHNEVAMNYLASPPLVVAYALAGTMDVDLLTEPLGKGEDGEDVYLADIWPDEREVARLTGEHLDARMFALGYRDLFAGDSRWRSLPSAGEQVFRWDPESTYLRRPPFFEGLAPAPPPVGDIRAARVLLRLGDSVTTDHICPAGRIPAESEAGRYLGGLGVAPDELNTYASRRGNHEVMVRGAFSNARLGNRLAPGGGGSTRDFTNEGAIVSVYRAAESYRRGGVPLVILAGREYGTGSSRDWAAKVTALSGVRVVLAASFERIHRANLVGMGVLPLQFTDGQDAEALGLDGTETFELTGIAEAVATAATVRVRALRPDGGQVEFGALARVDTPVEADYYRHGGILPFVYRRLLAQE